jgi:HemY protein
MMLKLFTFFVLLFLAVWIGTHLQDDPGYVLVSLHHWTIETTVWVAGVLVVLTMMMVHILLSLIYWLAGFSSSFAKWRNKRRALASQTRTRQGLIEFSEGHWARAKNYLIKALPDADTPLLNYLTAARAAQEMGDHQLRDNYLREAQQCMPEAKIAVELTQAQLQLANRQWEQALATLRHLRDIAPKHPYVLKLLIDLYQQVKDWPQLIALLPDLKRYRVVTGSAFEVLQHHANLQALLDSIKQGQKETVDTFFSNLPKLLTEDLAFVAPYCQFLVLHQDDAAAEPRLSQCLRKDLNDELLSLYGELKIEVARFDFVESLLKKNSHSAALYLCLAKLCNKKQLWGKAKTYFEASLQLAATPTVYAELGKLLEQLGDKPGAFSMYRQGLLLAT